MRVWTDVETLSKTCVSAQVRRHRQSRWLDERGHLKGDRPYELVFDITAAWCRQRDYS